MSEDRPEKTGEQSPGETTASSILFPGETTGLSILVPGVTRGLSILVREREGAVSPPPGEMPKDCVCQPSFKSVKSTSIKPRGLND